MEQIEYYVEAPGAYDVKRAIEEWLAEGFTLETLAIATNIPREILEEFAASGKQNLEYDPDKRNGLMATALLLTHNHPKDNAAAYFSDLVEELSDYFKIDKPTLARFAGVSEADLAEFTSHYDLMPWEKRHQIGIQLLYLLHVLGMNHGR